MTRFVQLTEAGSPAGPITLNVDHIIGVKSSVSGTRVFLTSQDELLVVESYDRVVELLVTT